VDYCLSERYNHSYSIFFVKIIDRLKCVLESREFMLGDNLQTTILIIILLLVGLVLDLIGASLQHKGKISKSVFRYIYTPLILLPTFLVMTYLIWPGNALHFISRVLIGMGLIILSSICFYLIWEPIFARIFPSYKKYLEEKNRKK